MNTIKWYKDRVCINVLANNLKNAEEVYKAANKHVVVGILSKQFATNELALEEMKRWKVKLENNISIGLGAGDPKQCYMVAELTKEIKPNHANQVFTAIGLTNYNYGQNETYINCLVSPTGKVGYVKINTGPMSSQEKDAIISVETAIEMIKDMGGNSIKFFNMNGLKHIEEFKAVANACAKKDFGLEPTGGIDLNNFKVILEIAINAGVKKIIPHVYSSIIDKETGETKVEDVKKIMRIIKELL